MEEQKLTFDEKWRLVFRKHPEAKYNRAIAYWLFGEEFYEFKIYAMKEQLMSFFKDFAGIERSIRDILHEEEFKLPAEQEAKRYEKESEFVRNLPKSEKVDYKYAFNELKEEQEAKKYLI